MIELVKLCAEEVYRELGQGYSETVYESAMMVELSLRNTVGPATIMKQVPCEIRYKGFTVSVGYLDILINNTLIVELKAVATKLTIKEERQVMKYLTALDVDEGLLINFGPELEIIEVTKGGQ